MNQISLLFWSDCATKISSFRGQEANSTEQFAHGTGTGTGAGTGTGSVRNRQTSGLVESHALGGSLEFCLGLFQPLSLNHWHRQLPIRFCEPQGQHHVHSSRFGANKALKSSILHVDAPKLIFSWVLEDVVQVLACRLNRLLRRNVSDVEVFITGFRLIPYITITLFAGLGVAGSLRRAKMRSRSLEPSSILRPL